LAEIYFPFHYEKKSARISEFPIKTQVVRLYKAAANELKRGEFRRLQLEEFVIVKGAYISITIHNFMDNISKIGVAFNKLIGHPQIDPKGACIEWYLDDLDCKCMVKLK
jgi:hypothetical protein